MIARLDRIAAKLALLTEDIRRLTARINALSGRDGAHCGESEKGDTRVIPAKT